MWSNRTKCWGSADGALGRHIGVVERAIIVIVWDVNKQVKSSLHSEKVII